MEEIKFIKTTSLKAKYSDESSLGFGKCFTDYMFMMEFDHEYGWHSPRVQPYQNLSINPAATVFHYAQEIYEGLKAYRADDGEVLLFRVSDNAARMNRSGDRMCIPPIDEAMQVKAINTIVDIERDWLPKSEGTSLYIRPVIIGIGSELGVVNAAPRYIYYILCSPSGAYYPRGIEPIRIRLENKYVRAVQGGTGAAKTGGNYAGSLKATRAAIDDGFDQVLWLDGRERKYVEEVGAMNMMFVIDGVLCTPSLGDTILAGNTRDSLLRLARDQGLQVQERNISVDELIKAFEDKKLSEAFGCGTAAVITPVGELNYEGHSMVLNDFKMGPLARKMYDTLTGIQYGRIPDPYGWVTRVPRQK